MERGIRIGKRGREGKEKFREEERERRKREIGSRGLKKNERERGNGERKWGRERSEDSFLECGSDEK